MKVFPQPRSRKRMHHMLFVTMLLLLYCCFFAGYSNANPAIAEHRCIHDAIAKQAGPPSTAIVLRLPRQRRSAVQLTAVCGSEWRPIRFSVFTEDMNNESRYCSAVGQKRPNFQGGKLTCQATQILTDAKRNIIVNEIIPRAARLHAERLLVEPVTGSIVVPRPLDSPCILFTVPRSHHTEGVANADIVLYAAAGPILGKTLAWASQCTNLRNGRAVVGVININPLQVLNEEYFVRISAHEIAHILGFQAFNFQRAEMVSSRTGVRGKPKVSLLTSPRVVKKTRAHYNCPTALGMELEDEGEIETVSSHWEMRNAKDELMAPQTGIGYYSALTMAAFEDLGYFRANWSMAETMNWGRNAGCDLLEKKCVSKGTTKYPDMFCTGNNDNHVLLCASGRFGLGRCQVKYHEKPLPPQFQYFNNPHVGGLSGTRTDYCPVILHSRHTRCSDGLTRHMLGSRVGPSSRCLKGDNLYFDGKRIGDVCAEVQCKHGSVSVRHFGNEAWRACPEGGSIRLRGYLKGRIMCPKYSEVCYETGRDKGETDLSPTKSKISELETNVTLNQANEVDLFVPWVTKVPERVGDTDPAKGVKFFKSPLLVATGGVLVAFAEADYAGINGNISIDIVARYIETEGNNWAEKASEMCGKRWNSQLAMQLNGLDYRFQLGRPLAVGKGNKIYLLAVSYAYERVQNNDWIYKGWNFVVTVGEIKAKSDVQGGKIIHWQPPRSLDQTFVKQFKGRSKDMLPYGGSASLTLDGDVVFVVKGKGEDKYISAILQLKDTEVGLKYEWSFVESATSCYFPSFFGWEGKIVMVPNCTIAGQRVKESIDMGKTWTDAAAPFDTVWESLKGKQDFTVATIDNVTLLLYTEHVDKRTPVGEMKETRLLFTDGYRVLCVGVIISDYKLISSNALVYTNGELFFLYQQLNNKVLTNIFFKRLKGRVDQIWDVLRVWADNDKYLKKLCSETALKGVSPDYLCITPMSTDGLVGFLSDKGSATTWEDEYLFTNATVKKGTKVKNGFAFIGAGSGAKWPVGRKELREWNNYAKYGMTVVATVSIHEVPTVSESPLLTVRWGAGKNRVGLKCGKDHLWRAILKTGKIRATITYELETWEKDKKYRLALVLQGSGFYLYVNGVELGQGFFQPSSGEDVFDIQDVFIGGYEESGGAKNNVRNVTVTNVFLYNRPLNGIELWNLGGTIESMTKFNLFVPWVTKVPERVGDTDPAKGVKFFKSPLLVATGGVLVAFAEADYAGINGNISIDIVARYIETEGNNWAEKASEMCGKRWNSQLAMQLNGLDYRFQLGRPLAVGKGNKIYLLAVSYAYERVQNNDWIYKGWNFVVTVGEIKAKSDVQGGKIIHWQPPRSLDQTFVKQFKGRSKDMLPYGGSASLTLDGDVVFVVKGKGEDKYISAILQLKDTEVGLKYEWSFVESATSCYFPSFFGWEGKIVMVPNCTIAGQRVKESIDMGKTWTDAAAPFDTVWESLKGKQDFTVATIDNVTLLLYTEHVDKRTPVGEIKETRLLFTDGYRVLCVGVIISDYKLISSNALVYTNGELFFLYQQLNNKGSTDIILQRLKDKVREIRNTLKAWRG